MFSHADYVYTVYQERSFTKAAEKLYISQPALSATVAKLEERLGYPIFQRGSKEVTLTYMGEKYIKAAEQVLAIQRQLEIEVDDLLQLRKGSITLGGTTFIASYILPGLLRKFGQLYPDIEIKLMVEQSTILRDKLEKGLVDIAIDNTISYNPEYKYVPLFREQILVGVPEDFAINEQLQDRRISRDRLSDLEQLPQTPMSFFREQPFILLKSGNNMRRIASDIFAESGISPNVCYEFDQLMTSLSFAENGFGVCFLTDTILKCAGPRNNLCLYRPETSYSDRMLYIIHRKSRYLSAATQALIRFLTEQ